MIIDIGPKFYLALPPPIRAFHMSSGMDMWNFLIVMSRQPLTYRSNSVAYAFVWEKVEIINFLETIVACEL